MMSSEQRSGSQESTDGRRCFSEPRIKYQSSFIEDRISRYWLTTCLFISLLPSLSSTHLNYLLFYPYSVALLFLSPSLSPLFVFAKIVLNYKVGVKLKIIFTLHYCDRLVRMIPFCLCAYLYITLIFCFCSFAGCLNFGMTFSLRNAEIINKCKFRVAIVQNMRSNISCVILMFIRLHTSSFTVAELMWGFGVFPERGFYILARI